MQGVQSRLLAQARATTIPTSIYSPASNIIGVVKQVVITNTTATATTYRVFLDIDGTTYDENSSLFWDISVAQGETDLVSLWMPLTSVGNLAFQASANDRLTITVGGYEVVQDEFFQERPLGQLRPSVVNTPVSIFSPVSGIRAVVRGMVISNVNNVGAAAEYSVYLDHDGTTYNDTTAIMRQITLNTGTTDAVPLYLPMEDSAGNLAVETNVGANDVTFTVFGFLEPL